MYCCGHHAGNVDSGYIKALEQFEKEPPYPFVYNVNGELVAREEFLPQETLFGIKIGNNTILMVRTFTNGDLAKIEEITPQSLSAWAKEKFKNVKNPRIITKRDFKLLERYEKLPTVFDFLRMKGFSLSRIYWVDIGRLEEEKNGEVRVIYREGRTSLAKFLSSCDMLMMCDF